MSDLNKYDVVLQSKTTGEKIGLLIDYAAESPYLIANQTADLPININTLRPTESGGTYDISAAGDFGRVALKSWSFGAGQNSYDASTSHPEKFYESTNIDVSVSGVAQLASNTTKYTDLTESIHPVTASAHGRVWAAFGSTLKASADNVSWVSVDMGDSAPEDDIADIETDGDYIYVSFYGYGGIWRGRPEGSWIQFSDEIGILKLTWAGGYLYGAKGVAAATRIQIGWFDMSTGAWTTLAPEFMPYQDVIAMSNIGSFSYTLAVSGNTTFLYSAIYDPTAEEAPFQEVARFPVGFYGKCMDSYLGALYVGGHYGDEENKIGAGSVYVFKEGDSTLLFSIGVTEEDWRILSLKGFEKFVYFIANNKVFRWNIKNGGYSHCFDIDSPVSIDIDTGEIWDFEEHIKYEQDWPSDIGNDPNANKSDNWNIEKFNDNLVSDRDSIMPVTTDINGVMTYEWFYYYVMSNPASEKLWSKRWVHRDSNISTEGALFEFCMKDMGQTFGLSAPTGADSHWGEIFGFFNVTIDNGVKRFSIDFFGKKNDTTHIYAKVWNLRPSTSTDTYAVTEFVDHAINVTDADGAVIRMLMNTSGTCRLFADDVEIVKFSSLLPTRTSLDERDDFQLYTLPYVSMTISNRIDDYVMPSEAEITWSSDRVLYPIAYTGYFKINSIKFTTDLPRFTSNSADESSLESVMDSIWAIVSNRSIEKTGSRKIYFPASDAYYYDTPYKTVGTLTTSKTSMHLQSVDKYFVAVDVSHEVIPSDTSISCQIFIDGVSTSTIQVPSDSRTTSSWLISSTGKEIYAVVTLKSRLGLNTPRVTGITYRFLPSGRTMHQMMIILQRDAIMRNGRKYGMNPREVYDFIMDMQTRGEPLELTNDFGTFDVWMQQSILNKAAKSVLHKNDYEGTMQLTMRQL